MTKKDKTLPLKLVSNNKDSVQTTLHAYNELSCSSDNGLF